MVRQAQKEGQAKAASPEVARVASSIKKSDAKDFASTKHKGLPEKKKMNEEGYDHLRDRGMIPPTKGKKDATTMPKSYKKSPEPKKGKSALDIVKANIRKQYGKGAIMGEDVNCADRKEMAAQHKAVHNKKKDETGGMPATVTAKNRRGQMQGVDEAKVDQGRSDYGKASIRNYRRSGPGHDDPGMFDPEGKRGKTIEKRRAEHKARRGVKGAKVPEYKKEEVIKQKDGLWDNIHQKRERMKKGSGEKKAKKGDKDYPKTLNVEGIMGMVKRAAKVKAKKTTGRDAGAIAAKIMRDKEQKKYVSFLPANEGIKYDSKGSSMDYFLGADPKKTKEYKALKKKTKKEEYACSSDSPIKVTKKKKKKEVEEGTSYGLYKGTGKASGAMKKYLDKKAKMLTKKREAQSDAAKNNPHFDSTQPSPSGRNKYEHVSFKNYFTEGNNTARMLHKSKTSVTGNISADRGGDEKKNQASRKGLEKDLKKKGIGYKKGVGKYKYDSGETGTEVSYQTSKPDKMSKRRFGKTMRRLGRKHGQESVITKDKSKPARLHDTESKKPGKSINIGKSKGGSNPSGMGQTSGDKVRSGKLPNKSKKGAYHYG